MKKEKTKTVHLLLKYRIKIILIIAFLFTPYLASAIPGYASKENVDCSYCHSNNGPPQLNQVGIYYRNNDYSLQGYNSSTQENITLEPAVTGTSGKYIGLALDISIFISLAGIIAIILLLRKI